MKHTKTKKSLKTYINEKVYGKTKEKKVRAYALALKMVNATSLDVSQIYRLRKDAQTANSDLATHHYVVVPITIIYKI